MAKKTNIEGIDENFIINSFRQDDLTLPPSARATENPTDEAAAAPEPLPPEEQREEPRRRKARNKEQDYGALFLKEATIPARIGKTVYIRKEYHERIQLILRVIGKDEVSLFSYIDNVLAHHFDTFQEDIKKLYEQNNNLF
ncbi:MAG: DUF3408 domain-containing protein [Paraprevotella clara]|uniref:DUF3408 domain-containing protein n=1 Tax=Paraprevotella clara TaxID=454154 RepID=A0A6N3C8G5_9BACT